MYETKMELTRVKSLMTKLFRASQGMVLRGQFALVWVTLLASVSCISINHGDPPLLKELHAECTREGISVKLWFKKPFAGVAYSHGHYETTKCRYISHEEDQIKDVTESRGTNFSFLIPMKECGTVYYEGASSPVKQQKDTRADKSNEYEVFIENTLLIQSDPTIQEAGDVAKTLRCVWQKEIRQSMMASLPIGNGKLSPSKLFGNPQRVKTITAARHKSRPIQEDVLPPSNSSQNAARFNLRFQKKGQVQSVPFNDRGQHSRALELDESEDEDITAHEQYSKVFLKNVENNAVSALPLKYFKRQNHASSAAVTKIPAFFNWKFMIILRFIYHYAVFDVQNNLVKRQDFYHIM